MTRSVEERETDRAERVEARAEMLSDRRPLVAWVLVEKLKSLDLRRPEVSAQAHAANIEARKALEAEPY